MSAVCFNNGIYVGQNNTLVYVYVHVMCDLAAGIVETFGMSRQLCLIAQAWAGFEVKQRSYAKAQELFAQALERDKASGDTERQVSLLKAWGDAKVLDGALEEAAGLYEQALSLQPDSLYTIMVSH